MSYESIQAIVERFKTRTVYAQTYLNNILSPVEIKYNGFDIEIRNLDHIQPYLNFKAVRPDRFFSDSSDPSVRDSEGYDVSTSFDGKTFESVDKETRDLLQIYSIFHPAYILPLTEFDRIDEQGIRKSATAEGRYHTQTLPMSRIVKDIFLDNNQAYRMVRIVYYDEELHSMIQRDFPPFPDMITIKIGFY